MRARRYPRSTTTCTARKCSQRLHSPARRGAATAGERRLPLETLVGDGVGALGVNDRRQASGASKPPPAGGVGQRLAEIAGHPAAGTEWGTFFAELAENT